MHYSRLISRLFNINLFSGIKLGLQNVQQLQKILHFPDQSFHSIHIAGTNGKGSVTTKIARALELAGYRVGLYTSPHISCFRERIRINREMISEQDVEKLLSFLFELIESHNIPATFFELTTFLAFLYFAQEKVDFAVLETGLGGRLDATNVVTPCLSVITSISLDHTEILGQTIDEIAKEKAGIIKPKIPVVLGPHASLKIIQEIAHMQGSPCILVPNGSLLFEEENCLIAQTALNHLSHQFSLSCEAIANGLTAKPPCRFEICADSPTVIFDVAHNPDGLYHLFQAIKQHYPHHSLRLLFGLSKNKDMKECLQIIASYGTHFHVVESSNGRGIPPSLLISSLKDLKISPAVLHEHDSISSAVLYAKQEAVRQNQILVICGSFFIMREARQALGFHELQDPIDLNERYSQSNQWENSKK